MRAFILSLVLTIFLTACSNDDERVALPFEGTWSLVSYTSGDYVESYDENEIVWEFNSFDELIVTINTTLPEDCQLPVQTDGIYTYVASSEVISLEGTQYAVLFEDEVLIFDHNSAAGGTIIKFVPVKE